MEYALTPVETTCPACGHGSGALLWATDCETAGRSFVPRDLDPARSDALCRHIETLWHGRDCRVVRCGRCALRFADPFVAGDARFYELLYAVEAYPRRRWEYDVTRARLEALTQAEGRRPSLLEIGAGSGVFLDQVVPALVDREDVVCTEYSSYGLERLRTLGVTALAEDFRSLRGDGFDGRFDVVCMFQVLEHLDDIDGVFAALDRLTTPTARWFVSVPNPVSTEFNETHDLLLDMPPNHIGRWHRTSFEIAAADRGWFLVDHRVEPQALAVTLRRFAVDRVMRRGLEPGTIGYRVRRMRNRRLRRAWSVPLVALAGVRGLAHLPRMRRGDLGASQWVELARGTAEPAGPG